MAAQREGIVGGVLAVALGALAIVAVLVAPHGLHVPAWVVLAAGAAFILAGLALVARGTGQRLLARWLPALVIACLLVPAAWLALGRGPRRCFASGWGFASRLLGRHSDLLCRFAFGAAALLGVVMLLVAVREALRPEFET